MDTVFSTLRLSARGKDDAQKCFDGLAGRLAASQGMTGTAINALSIKCGRCNTFIAAGKFYDISNFKNHFRRCQHKLSQQTLRVALAERQTSSDNLQAHVDEQKSKIKWLGTLKKMGQESTRDAEVELEECILAGLNTMDKLVRIYEEKIAVHRQLSDETTPPTHFFIGEVHGPAKPTAGEISDHRLLGQQLTYLKGIADLGVSLPDARARYLQEITRKHAELDDKIGLYRKHVAEQALAKIEQRSEMQDEGPDDDLGEGGPDEVKQPGEEPDEAKQPGEDEVENKAALLQKLSQIQAMVDMLEETKQGGTVRGHELKTLENMLRDHRAECKIVEEKLAKLDVACRSLNQSDGIRQAGVISSEPLPVTMTSPNSLPQVAN